MVDAWDGIKQNIINLSGTGGGGTVGKPKIAIAVPYNGKWEPEWVMKVYIPLAVGAVPWCNKVPLLSKVPSLPLARDMLVANALKNECTHIYFADTDNVFEQPTDPNVALATLYQCLVNNPESKIVSGIYKAKQKTGFSWAMWLKIIAKDEQGNNKVGFTPIQEWTGNWIEVDVAGMGCCLIDMEVFKSVKRPWFHWEIEGDMSEDFYFFMKAKEQGYKLHAFTDVRLGHIGTMKVKSDGSFAVPEM